MTPDEQYYAIKHALNMNMSMNTNPTPPQSIPTADFKPRFDTSTTAGKIAVMQEAIKLGYVYLKTDSAKNWYYRANPLFDDKLKYYNFPTEPKRVLVPWTKDNCPREAWFREKGYEMEHRIIACTQKNICFLPDCIWVGFDRIDNWEHSLDNGRTWLPCGTWKEEV